MTHVFFFLNCKSWSTLSVIFFYLHPSLPLMHLLCDCMQIWLSSSRMQTTDFWVSDVWILIYLKILGAPEIQILVDQINIDVIESYMFKKGSLDFL